jgi:Fe-S cluster assembly protein SufD
MGLSIQDFAASHQEPQWLTVKRQVACDLSHQLPLSPALRKVYFVPPELTSHSLNLTNYATKQQQASGIILMDLLSAARQFPELVQENLMEKAISWRDNAVNARHLAYLQSGGFVFIPDNVHFDAPIDLSFLIDGGQQENHLLIIAGAGAQVQFTFQDHTHTTAKNRLMTEILLGDHAQVDFYDATLPNSKQHHRVLNAYLAQNAQLNTYTGLFNHGNARYFSNINLDGEGSQAQIRLVSLSTQQQKQEIKTRIINHSPHTDGFISQRGIVADSSQTTCDTTGQIMKPASDSYSNQINRLLTLNPKSQGKVDPILLIDNHDVVAGHAASVGKVNADQLYYLQTRGIPLNKARLLLTRSFLTPLIQEFPDQQVQNKLLKILEERINESK